MYFRRNLQRAIHEATKDRPSFDQITHALLQARGLGENHATSQQLRRLVQLACLVAKAAASRGERRERLLTCFRLDAQRILDRAI